MDKDIKYDFFINQTKNHLVQKYFSLRTKIFIDKWKLKHFSGDEDKYDKDAFILIVHKDNQCMGGGRLVIKKDEDTPLPMESPDFELKNILPELNLKDEKYAELSRVALINELRDGKYSAKMYGAVGDKAKSMGVRYVFASTTKTQARMARIACKNVGLELKILQEVKVPDLPTYEGNKMVLSIIDLTKTISTKYQEQLKVKDTI
jgi:N-acyl-L-homoserine lactone synthetase